MFTATPISKSTAQKEETPSGRGSSSIKIKDEIMANRDKESNYSGYGLPERKNLADISSNSSSLNYGLPLDKVQPSTAFPNPHSGSQQANPFGSTFNPSSFNASREEGNLQSSHRNEQKGGVAEGKDKGQAMFFGKQPQPKHTDSNLKSSPPSNQKPSTQEPHSQSTMADPNAPTIAENNMLRQRVHTLESELSKCRREHESTLKQMMETHQRSVESTRDQYQREIDHLKEQLEEAYTNIKSLENSKRSKNNHAGPDEHLEKNFLQLKNLYETLSKANMALLKDQKELQEKYSNLMKAYTKATKEAPPIHAEGSRNHGGKTDTGMKKPNIKIKQERSTSRGKDILPKHTSTAKEETASKRSRSNSRSNRPTPSDKHPVKSKGKGQEKGVGSGKKGRGESEDSKSDNGEGAPNMLKSYASYAQETILSSANQQKKRNLHGDNEEAAGNRPPQIFSNSIIKSSVNIDRRAENHSGVVKTSERSISTSVVPPITLERQRQARHFCQLLKRQETLHAVRLPIQARHPPREEEHRQKDTQAKRL
jgi:hypothetical protein